MNRIEERFNKLKSENKKAFIPYICAGDPSIDESEKLVYALEEAGADVIEMGIPFSDPLADGPVIQAASLRALNAGFKIRKFFELVKKIRQNSNVALVAMVYYSTIYGFGKEEFISLCGECGVDGIIIPDLPYEEYNEVESLITKADLCLIPLIAITSRDRIPMLVKKARGFIYCVSSLGVTGERKSFDKKVDDFIAEVKNNTDVPACVGFGISKREDVERFDNVADGVIVGSAIVRNIFENNCDTDKIKAFVSSLIK